VEVPQLGLMGKVPAIERAKNMAQATRALL